MDEPKTADDFWRERDETNLTAEQKLEQWGPGPWVDEPNHVEWRAHGLPCLAHRNPMGAWCGYVGVPPGHRYHGVKFGDRVPRTKALDEIPIEKLSPVVVFCEAAHLQHDGDDGSISLSALLEVHGGLTYSEACQGAICHVPAPGEPDNVWWLGFDCSHAWDLSPAGRASLRRLDPTLADDPRIDEEYRTLGYVLRETEGLARQLTEAT